MAKRDLLTNEVDIDLNVLGPTVLNRVGGHVHRTDVVIVDYGRRGERVMELLKALPKPTTIDDCMRHCRVLGLHTGARYSSLTLGQLGDEVVTEVDAVTRSRSS